MDPIISTLSAKLATDTVKGVSELANGTIRGATDLAKTSGPFLERIFGDGIENAVGIVADKIKYYRLENFIKLQKKVEDLCEKEGIKNINNVPPKIAIPLLEKATLEDNDDLNTKWAKLLKTAMDPNNKKLLNRSFLSILEDLEPLDAKILDVLYESIVRNKYDLDSILFNKMVISNSLNVSSLNVEISLCNLIRLGCLQPGVVSASGISFGGHSVASYKGTEEVKVSSLGFEFMKAVN